MDDYILIITNEYLATNLISYTRYDMRFLKVIMWSRWDHLLLVFEEIGSIDELQ